jgi:SAM-dependent methyltransferase
VVIDLGSGGGLDVLLAAQRVGPSGKAIGIDMTPEMIELGSRNASKSEYRDIIEFHLAAIDDIPLPDATADCIISNCVINLAPDKPAVFREIFRLLKPGGRLAVSDIALKQPLPDELAANIAAYIGCIAGAILIDQYRDGLLRAGFDTVEVIDSQADLNAYTMIEGQSDCCSPSSAGSTDLPLVETTCCTPDPAVDEEGLHQQMAELLRRYDVNQYAASVKIFALKP